MMSTGSEATTLQPGMVIANRFRLERLLGQGGMGSVWVAHHLTLNIEVAVKFIDGPGADRVELHSRFAHEAQAAAKINSPHVVRMVDYGADESGRPYIAMELLQGEELAKKLEREPQLSIRDAARVLTQACKGLTRAHQAGIVHRDLKPENIFLAADEDGFIVKILDFGIAKADSPIGSASHKTGTGQLIGTPTFMSPEQALGSGKIDSRSDLYSLGVVMYRCLTGRIPFDCEGLGELIVAIAGKEPPRPSELRPEVGAAIDAWFAKAMHKSPAERFASAKEMGDAFLIAANLSSSSTLGSSLSNVVPASVVPARPVEATTGRVGTLIGSSADDDIPKPPTSRPIGLFVGAGVALVALGAGAFFAFRSPPDPKLGAAPDARPTADASLSRGAAGQPPLPAVSVTPVEPTTVPSASASVDPGKKAPPPSGGHGRGTGKTPDGKTPDTKTPDTKTPDPKPPTPPAQKDYGI